MGRRLLPLAYSLGLIWLLLPRSAAVRRALRILALQDPQSGAWWILFALGLVLVPLGVVVLVQAAPRLLQRTDRRGYLFLAASEAARPWLRLSLTALLIVAAAGLARIAAVPTVDLALALRGVEIGSIAPLQGAVRPAGSPAWIDAVALALFAYAVPVLGWGLPAWDAWRRREDVLGHAARAGLALAAGVLLAWSLIQLEPPCGPDADPPCVDVLAAQAPHLSGLGTLWGRGAWPLLPVAFAGVALGSALATRDGLRIAATAAAGLAVLLATLYLGQSGVTASAAGLVLGAAAALATRSRA